MTKKRKVLTRTSAVDPAIFSLEERSQAWRFRTRLSAPLILEGWLMTSWRRLRRKYSLLQTAPIQS